MINNRKASFVLSVYNGSAILRRNLPDFLRFLTEKGIRHEIVIVDDGSRDREETRAIAEKFGCAFLQNKKNEGKGSAVRKGMRAATGDYRLFTDTDIPFTYESIERFLFYLDSKEFDVVVGDRTMAGSVYFTKISWLRRWGSALLSFLVGRFIVGGLFDTQCGLKGFRARVADDIFSLSRINGFAFDIEVLYIALKRNYDLKRLPVQLRCNEESSVNVFVHGIVTVKDLLVIKINHLLGRYNKK